MSEQRHITYTLTLYIYVYVVYRADMYILRSILILYEKQSSDINHSSGFARQFIL
jgi:hypothetical protein